MARRARPRKSAAYRARELRDAAATRRLTNLERRELADKAKSDG